MKAKEKLLQALVDLRAAVPYLRDGIRGAFSPKHGICHNIYGVCCSSNRDESAMDLLEELINEWPKRHAPYGKDHATAYPVGGYREYFSEEVSFTFWENPRRLELLDWLIETLTLETQNEKAE